MHLNLNSKIFGAISPVQAQQAHLQHRLSKFFTNISFKRLMLPFDDAGQLGTAIGFNFRIAPTDLLGLETAL